MAKKKRTWVEIIRADVDNEASIDGMRGQIYELEKKIDAAQNTINEKQYVRENYKQRGVGKLIAGSSFGITLCLFLAGIMILSNRDSRTVGVIVLVLAAATPVFAIVLWIMKRKKVLKEVRNTYLAEYVPQRNQIETDAKTARQEIEKLMQKINAAEKKYTLSEDLRPYMRTILGYFENARADTLQDAVDLLIKEMGQQKELSDLEKLLDEAKEAKYAALDEWEEMRQARVAAEQAENEAWWLELETSMDYLNRS